MDGTLIDSSLGWIDALIYACKQYGGTPDEHFMKHIRYNGPWAMAKYISETYSPNTDYMEIYDCMIEQVDIFYHTSVERKPNSYEALSELKKSGYEMMLLTGTERPQMEYILDRVGLLPLFDYTLTIEEAGGPMTSVIPYLKAAEVMGASSTKELVLIDDQPMYLEAATQAGMNCVAFYDAPVNPDKDQLLVNAKYIIFDWSEIL